MTEPGVEVGPEAVAEFAAVFEMKLVAGAGTEAGFLAGAGPGTRF